MNNLIVLSHYQLRGIGVSRPQAPTPFPLSLDLNRSTVMATLAENGLHLPDGQTLAWEQLDEIRATENGCYLVAESEIRKIQFFSETTGRFVSLFPTTNAPTMLVAGFPMHRIKNTEPYRDTLSKIKAAAPLSGLVLDTTMGLGYTAIEAAKTAQHVTTIELDPAVVEVCHLNPWSQALFANPKITLRQGDAFTEINALASQTFARVVHDPPVFSLAGDLYGLDFYRELVRILKPRGRVFHYIGDPDSKSGKNVMRGVIQRLQQAGFQRVELRPQAFGVVAYK
ncbi:MAG: methyltransferase domain-containing protein [Chloroflexi bacterium]|nr:methyltransferase domain-containing protein [Chloroflexota bacterium]MBP8059050.1 methyltransferase domain-containing protein [Chloroflexota bacterium]